MKKIIATFKDPTKIYNFFVKKGFFKWIPDRPFLLISYYIRLGKKLNLESPSGFNAKLQWLKLYDRNPEYTKMVDKLEVKKYISEKIGPEYVIPLIDSYNNFNEIDFEKLPNQFVLKCTHDSGGLIICKDKGKLNKKKAKKKINKSLKRNYYNIWREWPYKNVKPRIICEKYMPEGSETLSLTDYKFYCFNGEAKYCQVIRGRGGDETIDFYDEEWNLMPFNGLRPLPNSNETHSKPSKYEEMINLARKLSHSFPFVRVDFYYVNGKIKFGELTFFPQSGFGSFSPVEWNEKIGDLLVLDSTKKRTGEYK